ncbi:MAG: tetratricopeptide repeat protein [Candidatus Eisenbacteria bacterium]|nr:tetratricopeptide repeat protein [Candidatus Eisenbacteria bacterium]
MRKLCIFSAVLFVALSAPPAVRPSAAETDTARAWALLQEGRRTEADRLAVRAFANAASQREKGEALLLQALCVSDGEAAEAALSRFLSEYAGHPLEWRAEMELGLHDYAVGAYIQAGRHFSRAAGLKAPKREQVKARYWLGLSRMGSGNYTQSRREFEAVRTDDGGTGLSAAASLGVADCMRQEGSYAAALAEYTRLEAGPGGGDWMPQALHGAGVCLEKLKREAEAREVYGRLVREFPSSLEAVAVRSKLRAGVGAAPQKAAVSGYTIQAGAFSQEANARKLVGSLTRKGVTGLSVAREERGGRVLFIVYLGEFPTREAAQEKMRELSARLGLSFGVVAR